jgi:hypothetical protein
MALALTLAVPEPQAIVFRSDEHDDYPRALGGGTPAMRLQLTTRPIPIRELLAQWLFPTRVELPEEWARYYGG